MSFWFFVAPFSIGTLKPFCCLFENGRHFLFPWKTNIQPIIEASTWIIICAEDCMRHIRFDNSMFWIHQSNACICICCKQQTSNLAGRTSCAVDDNKSLSISQVLKLIPELPCAFPSTTSLFILKDSVIRIESTIRPKNYIFCVDINSDFSRFLWILDVVTRRSWCLLP